MSAPIHPPNGPNGERGYWSAASRAERMERDLYHLQQEIARYREERKDYVKHVEFRPVQMIAFGLISLIVLSVIGAWLSIVVGAAN
jgi:hypothetical protein